MARSKQQWRAEKKLALRLAPRAPVPHAEMVQLKAEHPQLRTDVAQAPVVAPAAAPATAVIDLTVEDEEEEDEEMGVVAMKEDAEGGTSVVRPSAESDVANNSVMDVSGERLAEGNADEESDVDEAWPQVGAGSAEAGAGTPETQELVSEDERGGDGDSNVYNQGLVSRPAAVVSNVLLLDDDEVEEDEALPIVAKESTHESICDATTTNTDTAPQSTTSGGEDLAVTTPATDWAGRILRIVETAALEGENLEDGEIFEEGAVVTSPTSVKRAIALERLASRDDSGSDVSVAMTQQAAHVQGTKKKHKKRGKKKSKRKLEAMMTDFAPPETPPIGFERITRQHSFAGEPTGSYETAPPPAALMSVSAPAPPSFGAPPSLFGASPPPQPNMPLGIPHVNHQALSSYRQYENVPPLPLPPLPPYEDNQMLRVNRQGSVEMFNGNRRIMPPLPLPPNHVITPPGHGVVGDGFKYRSIPSRIPPPPPMVRHAQQSHSADSSAASSPAPSFESPPIRRDDRLMSSTPTASINGADPEELADDGMDLDMLRAMALRTKRMRRSHPSAQAAGSNAAESSNKQSDATSGEGGASSQPNSEAHDTDNLDEDALLAMIRSSQKRKRTQKQGHSADEARTSVESSTSAAPTDAAVGSKQSESAATEKSAKNLDDETATEALPASTTIQVTASVHSSSKAPPPSSIKESTTARTTLTELPPTPVVRPLTACSQSLVIRLGEDDLVLADDDDVAMLNSPHSNTAPSQNVQDIRSAIDAMRRQIAEREKARAGGNKGAGAPFLSSASSSSSSSSNSLQPSPRSDGQKKVATANPGIQVVTSSSSLPSPAALQAEIRAMKERIAAKEREKQRQHEQQRQLLASSAGEPTTRAREAAAMLAMEESRGDLDNAGDQPTASKDVSLVKRYRSQYEACKAEIEESRRQLALVNAEVARLERELAVASGANGSPAQTHAVSTRG